MKALRRVLVACALLLLPGCAFFADESEPGPRPDPQFGVDVVDSGAVADFHARTQTFYERLSRRRFNTLATYEDQGLREFFRSQQAFSDWYANVAQGLADAHFEQNRPLAAEVVEFSFEGPGRARVQVVLKGDNGLPLRWWETITVHEDVWERTGDRWWILPGKL